MDWLGQYLSNFAYKGLHLTNQFPSESAEDNIHCFVVPLLASPSFFIHTSWFPPLLVKWRRRKRYRQQASQMLQVGRTRAPRCPWGPSLGYPD